MHRLNRLLSFSGLCLLLVVAAAACARYHAKPLNTQPALLHRVPDLVIRPARMPLPELATHPFRPADGLDMTEVAMLAVIENPELKAARDQRGIARAELMAAGVLPNPQITAEQDHPTTPGYGDAFTLGLDYDVSAFLTRGARIAAAAATDQSIDLTVLWQEWQVVQKARLLFVDSVEQQKEWQVVQALCALRDKAYGRAEQALHAGALTITDVLAQEAARDDAYAQRHALMREREKTRRALDALLGLASDVTLTLTGSPALPAPDQKSIDADLAHLPERRPDLLALQAGYASQEARFRMAVLAQFPSLAVGLIRSRDTSGVFTTGIGVTLDLPFFDLNQGAVAIAKATRKQLYDEYQARLNEAYAEVAGLSEQMRLVRERYDALQRDLPALEQAAAHAQKALASGDLTATAADDLESALFRKKLATFDLERTLLEQQVALQTLLGRELPKQATTGIVHLAAERN